MLERNLSARGVEATQRALNSLAKAVKNPQARFRHTVRSPRSQAVDRWLLPKFKGLEFEHLGPYFSSSPGTLRRMDEPCLSCTSGKRLEVRGLCSHNCI